MSMESVKRKEDQSSMVNGLGNSMGNPAMEQSGRIHST